MTRNILVIRNAAITDFGGGERVPVNMSIQLKNLGYKPIIVSRLPKLLEFASDSGLPIIKGWWWSRQDWSGIRVLLTPFYILWQLILAVWYFVIILRTKSDVVHAQSKDDFIAATIAARVLGRRVVWSDYADLKYIYQNNRVWYKNPVGKIVFFLSRFASSIILTSQNDKKLIEESLGQKLPDNYRVVHYGVMSDEVQPTFRPKNEKDSIIFVATSRLVAAKGIGELLSAFNEISKTRKDVRLWLFGEGSGETTFKQHARSNKRITFWGYPSDALARVATCDVFVHPSYLEGFSISLVEAAKFGLPIIACDVGGNPELVEHGVNGLLVPARDPVPLADAMAKLADSGTLRKKYGSNARKTYESHLMFENIVKEKIAPLYEK